MASFTTVFNQLLKMRDSVKTSTDMSAQLAEGFIPYLEDVFDPLADSSLHVTGEEASAQSIIDYVKDREAINFSCGENYVIRLYYTSSTEVIEGQTRLFEYVMSTNNEGQDEYLVKKEYSSGLGDYYYRVNNTINNYNGSPLTLSALSDNVMSTWANNTIVNACLNSLIPNLRSGFNWNENRVRNFIQDFKNNVECDIDMSKTRYQDAKSTYNYVIQQSRGGLGGLLNLLKFLYQPLKTTDVDDENNAFHFIDNNQYASVSALSGVIDTISDVLMTVATLLVATGSFVVGLISTALQFVGRIISRIVNAKIDELVYAEYDDSEGLFQPEYPFGVKGGSVQPQDSQIYDPLNAAIGNYLKTNGSFSLSTCFANFYVWKSAEEVNYDINFQIRPIANTDFCIDDLAITTVNHVGDHVSSVTLDFSSFNSEDDFAQYMATVLRLSQSELHSDLSNASATDIELKKRCASSVNALIVLLCYFDCQRSGTTSISVSNSTPNPSILQYLLFQAIPMFHNDWAAPDVYYQTTTWDNVIGNNTAYPNTYFGGTNNLDVGLFADLIGHLFTYSDQYTQELGNYVLTTCTNIPEANITIPKYEKSDLIRSIVLTGIIVSVTAVVATIGFVKTKKFVNTKRASVAANAENSWEDFKAQPNAQNYKAYRRAVKKNNRFVSLYGGTKYSTDGFWAATDASDANLETITDSVTSFSAENDVAQSSDITGIDYIKRLIAG